MLQLTELNLAPKKADKGLQSLPAPLALPPGPWDTSVNMSLLLGKDDGETSLGPGGAKNPYLNDHRWIQLTEIFGGLPSASFPSLLPSPVLVF